MTMVDCNEQSPLVLDPTNSSQFTIFLHLGTLAPSFQLNSQSSIDLLFATYWIHSDTSSLLHADERACIEEGMKNEEDRLKSDNSKEILSNLFSLHRYCRRNLRNGS